MTTYVALLRGINVGGKNLIKMTDLADSFEAMGLENVRTYIQSGNVIFRADSSKPRELARRIEDGLSSRFPYEASLVLKTMEELRSIVNNAPADFGSQPDVYRSDVLFLMDPVTAADVIQQITPKEGVDQAFAGEGVLYFARLTTRAAQSRLTRIIGTPVYQNMTIRNWNTTTKLLEMMETVDH